MNRLVIALSIAILLALNCHAANQRNYIYVFDCTYSMKSNKCWDTSKDFLQREIAQRNQSDNIIILPFEKDVKSPITSRDWKEIEPQLEGYCNQKTKTNICDAWSEAVNHLNPRAENYLILLTDGKHEYGNGHSDVAAMLKRWKLTNPDNVYGFYVMLNAEAVGVKNAAGGDDPEHRLWFIDATASIPEFGAFATQRGSTPSNTLINGGADVPLGFSCASPFPATIACGDPHFDVQLKEIKEGKAVFHVTSRVATMEELDTVTGSKIYRLEIAATATNPNQRILNTAIIKIKSPNGPELDCRGFINDKASLGSAAYTEPTLFGLLTGDSINPIEYNIRPRFNPMAGKLHSWAEIKVEVDDPTITILVDGRPATTFRCEASNPRPVKISFLCAPETAVGDHVVTFTSPKTSKGLVVQNENPAKFRVMKQIGFRHRWHTAKTCAMWLGIALLAFLALWLLMLRRMFYPVIKAGKLQVSGDCGFQTKKIQGARRVVLSNRKVGQSWISRHLTAPIISLVHPSWTSPITLEPGGSKKVRLIINRDVLDIDPYAVNLQPQVEYKITDKRANTNHTLIIN